MQGEGSVRMKLKQVVADFLHNPKVIFFDEPTIGLDVLIKSKIGNLIRDLNRRNGAAILVTTHDISDIEALCRLIVIIDQGRIIFDGDIDHEVMGCCKKKLKQGAMQREGF